MVHLKDNFLAAPAPPPQASRTLSWQQGGLPTDFMKMKIDKDECRTEQTLDAWHTTWHHSTHCNQHWNEHGIVCNTVTGWQRQFMTSAISWHLLTPPVSDVTVVRNWRPSCQVWTTYLEVTLASKIVRTVYNSKYKAGVWPIMHLTGCFPCLVHWGQKYANSLPGGIHCRTLSFSTYIHLKHLFSSFPKISRIPSPLKINKSNILINLKYQWILCRIYLYIYLKLRPSCHVRKGICQLIINRNNY